MIIHTSLMRLSIIDISYKIKNKGNIRTTVCKIRWINPITGNTQKTYGTAVCNPNEYFNKEIGEHIAESRAKRDMYADYISSARKNYYEVQAKYTDLIMHEQNHIDKIINSLK